MSEIPVLKFGGLTLQGKSRFGPAEGRLLEKCKQMTQVNDIYRLLALRRNAARAWRLREVAEKFVICHLKENITPVVVVSAFDWATDKLEQLAAWTRVVCGENAEERATRLAKGEEDIRSVVAYEVGKLRAEGPWELQREFAQLLMSGELRANATLALVLESLGYRARSLTGRQAGIITSPQPVDAHIEKVEIEYLTELVEMGIVPVVAGFQGYYHCEETGRDEVSILGRGGSNLTAVALASALGQTECVMFSNVDGLYSRDPDKYEDAWKYQEITAAELFSWEEFPQVIQREAVEYACEHGVDIWIRSGFEADAPGTLIKCRQ